MALPQTLISASLAGMVGLGQGLDDGLSVRVDCGRMLAKALPSVEGGERAVYFQAGTETRDYQGERILAKALVRSIPYFLRHGRIDLDHGTVPVPDEKGVPIHEIRNRRLDDPYLYEIGKPVDASVGPDGLIRCKASIFKGESGNPWTAMADVFWGSLKCSPPADWYPSVQGLVTNEIGVVDDNLPTQEIRGMLWQSVGLSRNPVSRDVPAVTTVPLRVFAKALGSSKGIRSVLSELRGVRVLPPAPALEAPGELSETHLMQVLEALADASKGMPPADFLQGMERSGVPQDHSLAVLLALLSPA